MRALLLAALCLVTLVAVVPAASAQPPGGGSCHVVARYFTEASIDTDPTDGSIGVKPGAPHPVECYY